jgi:hypothetical protein
MAALDFPGSPALDEEYTANGRTWTWNGETWRVTVAGNGASGALDFPAAPDVDEVHSENGRDFRWDGDSWRAEGFTAAQAFEPWGEVARQETIASGKLTISGLDLSGIQVVRLFINGVTVTTDDSQVLLRFLVAGSEVSTGYQWGHVITAGTATASSSDSSIHLTTNTATEGVGNASTEGFGAVVTIYNPGSTSLFKRANYKSTWVQPAGTLQGTTAGGGSLDNTGALTGFALLGSSNLTGGTMIVLGVE